MESASSTSFQRTLADLRDVLHATPRFRDSDLLRHVHDVLTKKPGLPGVLVEREDGSLAVISRAALGRQMSRQFFREIHLKRPIACALSLFPSSLLALEEEESIRTAIRRGLQRPAAEIYEPIVVIQQHGEPSLLEMHTLLLDQCQALSDTTRELEKERDAADAAARSKGEFLANMSHEIRTPMTAILGFAEILLEPEIPTDERERQTRTILRNGEHLLSILDDILDLSKIEAGRLEISRRSCELAVILSDTIRLFVPRAATKGLTLSYVPAPNLPKFAVVDAQRLRQILFNLLSNAIKFTDQGSVELACTWECGPNETVLVCSVTDTGIGIPQAEIARLFQPFHQVDGSASRRHGGTGLGLVISRRLAEMMSGELSVSQVSPRGSCFTLRLPTSAGAPETEPVAPVVADPKLEPAIRPQVFRVLLAEDGRDNQLLVGTFFRRAGYEIEFVDNGLAAVEMLTGPRAQSFHLLLLDMQMPILDGYGAASALRQRGWTAPIVALTAHSMAGDRERCLAAGCDEHVSKPIDRQRLLSVCARLLTDSVQAPLPSTEAVDPIPVRSLPHTS